MNRLVRTSHDKRIAGVCGGLAQYFGVDSTLVRFGYTALTLFSCGFPGVLLYFLAILIIPEE